MSVNLPLIGPSLLDTSLNDRQEMAGSNVSRANLANEFESLFFSLLIKNMRSSLTEDGLFGSEASDTYGGLFDLYMGQHLATSKGLGIAQMLESYVPGTQSNVENVKLRFGPGQDTG